jgi:transposase-like protein
MAISFKGAHFPPDIILMGVRWYVAYPLSTRHVEELMLERGVHVDHSTINRWVVKYSPQLNRATQHWHTGSARQRVLSVESGYRVYECPVF